MTSLFNSPPIRGALGVIVLTLAVGCSALLPKATPHPSLYALEGRSNDARIAERTRPPAPTLAPTLIVTAPRAAAGFDTKRIVYLRIPNKIEYFAHSEWVDTPASMLTPLIVAAVEYDRTFSAIVSTPSSASGDISLDTEIIRLQQVFGAAPSHVFFSIRATLVDSKTLRVISWREFNTTAIASSDDPYGGVIAADYAVQAPLVELSAFCDEGAAEWQRFTAEATTQSTEH